MSASRNAIASSMLVFAALSLTACNSSPPPPASTETVAPQRTPSDGSPGARMGGAPVSADQNAREAKVVLKPTRGHVAAGTMTLRAEAGGVRITGEITGLKPGSEHGFHIHENGDCSAPDATSAGGHFNPTGQPHGSMEAGTHHAGDMPNQRANAEGVANVDVLVKAISLDPDSNENVIGRALIVHKQPDDHKSQPAGDAGPRIACGVITSQ